MFFNTTTIAMQGLEIIPIDVQVFIGPGLPNFHVVGLPDKTIAESRERIRAALSAIGVAFPLKRIVVNLSPADIFKEGSHYDLPIALAILGVMKIIPEGKIENYIIMGELSLDGKLVPIFSVLPAACKALDEKKGLLCPAANAEEALLSENPNILAPVSIGQIVNYFKNQETISFPSNSPVPLEIENTADMKDIKGQESAKRAIMIAAAGAHNILMIGPPGTGKSMLAKRLPGILPALDKSELLMINMVASVAGNFNNQIKQNRPFREPHHSCSMAAMIGGGKYAKPGEITLAHNGVLFLDELPEFPKPVIDALRQPLEYKKIMISRANAKITYPANFQLVAAMNPCRCGYLDDFERKCKRSDKCGVEYRNKISGPLLDRVDLHIQVPNVNIFELSNNAQNTTSKELREKVKYAREIQKERYKSFNIRYNAEAEAEILDKFTVLDQDSKALLKGAMTKYNFSIRGYKRILKVARTIADLEGSNNINKNHLAEALYYREI